jgi:lipopolysaccharide biosynthesis glycosyltransferase
VQLQRLGGVEVIALPASGVAVPIRRLLDFQAPLKHLPEGSVVAYWDAGDVIFQDRLTELWRLARENPERLLVVAEPFGYPENDVVARWTLSISDPAARKHAFDLLSTRPYFNGGFAAGAVAAMLQYLQSAHELLHSKALRGTTDWGDQTAMNLYCHSDSKRFLAIDDRWNYCICQRPLKDRQLLPAGRFARHDGRRLSVIHGNGAAFVPYATFDPVALARSSGTTRFLI